MGLLKDAEEPHLSLTQTAAASVPNASAGTFRLFIDVDGDFKLKDDAGTVFSVGESLLPGFAVPTVVLDDTPAEGVATTGLRSDATILAFDATNPTTGGFNDAADDGSASVAAKRDHRHGWPAQEAANPDTSGATLGQLETEVNEVKAALRAVGLIDT